MENKIIIPHNSRMQVCYQTIQENTPSLWQSFQNQLLTAAHLDELADNRIQKIVQTAEKIWQDFVAEDPVSTFSIKKESWMCCVGDLVEALLELSIKEISNSTEPIEHKRKRLESLVTLVKRDLQEAPNSPGMVLELLATLQRLA
jgi:hypothetical protein